NSPTYSVSNDSEISFSSSEDFVVPNGDSESSSSSDYEGTADGLQILQANNDSPETDLDDDMDMDSLPADSSTNHLAYSLDVSEEGFFSSAERPNGLNMLRMTYMDSELDSVSSSLSDHEGTADGLRILQTNYDSPETVLNADMDTDSLPDNSERNAAPST
ncbi:hypothetical protein MKX03_037869, partial [Papaver bracteatum]